MTENGGRGGLGDRGMEGAGERAEAFVTACRRSDRKAIHAYLKNRGVMGKVDPAVLKAVKEEYARLPILLDPVVRGVATEALLWARGPQAPLLAVTLWPNVYSAHFGITIRGSPEDFVEPFRAAASLVRPKGKGRVYNPTTTTDGHRCNASTRSVHALVLDCDGTGDWEPLLGVLGQAGFAFIAHRSGGHTPTVPKWRLLLPLASPFTIDSPQGVAAWRTGYAIARTALGAVGLLRGPGFDPGTDAPSHPWFPGYRRSRDAPPREVLFSPGASFDLFALLAHLPKLDAAPRSDRAGREPQPMQVKRPTSVRRRREQGVPIDRAPPSNLERAFVAAGLAGPVLADGKWAVRCPWNHLHSEPLPDEATPTSSTVLFPPSRWNPNGTFYCSHSSCGTKPYPEVLAMLPSAAARTAGVVPQSPSPPRPPRRGRVRQFLGQPRAVPHSVPRLRSL